MAFEVPTNQEILDRTEGDMESRVPDPKILDPALVAITPAVIAGASIELHAYLSDTAKQGNPKTANDENFLLWLQAYGDGLKPAEFAEGNYEFTGVNTTAIPIDELLTHANGKEYKTLAAGVISGGVFQVAIRATEAGADSNVALPDTMTLVSPIIDIDDVGNLITAIDGGANEETIEQAKIRFFAELADPPQGGAETDYNGFALEVAGVTRAFIFGGFAGRGTVGVAILDDNLEPPIPSQTIVDNVQANIDSDDKRPRTDFVIVYAPFALPTNFDITLTLDTPERQAAVIAALKDLYAVEAVPASIVRLSKITEVISVATDGTGFVLNSPTTDQLASAGQLQTIGTFAF